MKIKNYAIIVFGVLLSSGTQAQTLRIATEAGLNATALTFTVPELVKAGKGTSKSPLLPGLRAGITVSFKTTAGLRPGIGLFLSRRSANFENPEGALTQYTTYKDRMYVLEVLVFLEYHFNDTYKSHLLAPSLVGIKHAASTLVPFANAKQHFLSGGYSELTRLSAVACIP